MAVRVETVPRWYHGRFASWFVTVDHKRIGILYIATSGFFFLCAGVMALLMRTQLAQADMSVVEQDGYNQLFTVHGTMMVFLVVVPCIVITSLYDSRTMKSVFAWISCVLISSARIPPAPRKNRDVTT